MAGIGDVAAFFKSAKLSDITIKYGGHFQLPAHKLILVQHSKYFEAMFNGSFCESDSRTIEVKDDEPFAFKGLIAYCYGLQYAGNRNFTKDGLDPTDAGAQFSSNAYLMYQVNLYVVAEKYLVPTLCTQILNDFPSMLRKLMEEANDKFTSPAGIVDHVYAHYGGAAAALQKPIIELLVEIAPAWKSDAEFQAILLATPQLAVHMVMEMAETITVASPNKRPSPNAVKSSTRKRRLLVT